MRYRLEKAAERGISLESPPPPDGYRTKGVSTLYDADGNVRAKWVKNDLDREKQQALMEETLSAFMEPLKGLAKPTKAPKPELSDYMAGFPIGDAHIGLYAWAEQCGYDWDSKIAEAAICQAMDEVISAAPATEECFIWQLGDWLHVDSAANMTAAGTPQDTDSRFPKIVRTSIRTLRHITERALQKYRIVNIRNAKGNHDQNSAVVLDEALKAFYENESRLKVHDTAKPVFIHRWHSNLFGITHGHAPKPDRVPAILAFDAPEDWSLAKHKFVHHGHFHQKQRKLFQDMGVDVECHSAPTAPERWTIEQGYRSTSEVKSIIYHKTEGEKRRYISQVKRI